MTLLNSQFDVISRDPHKNAQAGLMVVLAVEGAPSPYGSLPASGTPVAGNIPAGAIVVMNANGKAVVADNDDASTDAPQMLFITVDGNMDYDGAFVHKLTCIQGGGEFLLDTNNYVAGAYAPGDKLTCGDAGTSSEGKFRKATTGEQIYGMVGPDGQDTEKYTLAIIIPQGISPAAA
jgi:hypothetical protein